MIGVGVTYEVLSINPSLAREWLAATRSSNRIDQRLLDSYSRDMSAGLWKLNGDPLIFDVNGVLLDGRLRLLACVEADVEFSTLIIRGIDPSDFYTIDALRRRTASDIMHIRGEPHGRALAAALSFLWRAARGEISKPGGKISAPELIELLEKNGTVRRSIEVAKAAHPTMPHGLGAGLHFLFQNEDRRLADDFFSKFSGEDAVSDGPVFALRRALENMLEEGGRRSPVMTAALAFKAWYAFKEGRDVKLLRFSPDKEEFPDTPGLDGLESPQLADVPHQGLQGGLEKGVSGQDSSSISVDIMEISPQIAAEILAANDKNRKIASGVVDKYVRDMAEGRWALNGQTIKIGRSGRLLDGQHRLSAAVKGNQSFVGIIVKGLDESVFDTFDVGNKRALADILADMGEINTALLGGSVRQLWQLESDLVQARAVMPSVNELLDTLERHPKLRDSVSQGNNFRKLGAPSQLVALDYCFHSADDEKAKSFVEGLIFGDLLTRGSPILLLRDILIQDKNNPKLRMGAPERIALTIKAWNLFVVGSDARFIRWSAGREAFPRIRGLSFGGVERP